jgi:hypothetical protein
LIIKSAHSVRISAADGYQHSEHLSWLLDLLVPSTRAPGSRNSCSPFQIALPTNNPSRSVPYLNACKSPLAPLESDLHIGRLYARTTWPEALGEHSRKLLELSLNLCLSRIMSVMRFSVLSFRGAVTRKAGGVLECRTEAFYNVGKDCVLKPLISRIPPSSHSLSVANFEL